jgi:gliding motility-associated-like protein
MGYGKPWAGTYNGASLPTGTYYYIIDLKDGRQKLSGQVTIIR